MKKRLPKSRFDPSSRTYQCNSCAGAERLIADVERRVLKLAPKKYLEKIQSKEQRLERLRIYHSQLNPNFKATDEDRKRGHRNLRGKTSKEKTKANLLRRWSGKDLPKSIRFGLCVVCYKLVMTYSDVAKFHWSCHQRWESTEQGKHFQSLKVRGEKASLPAGKPGPGRRVTEESLKRSYSWAVQHYLGEKSLRDIAKENGVHFTSVRDGIKSIIETVPPAQLVGSRFRRAIQLLLDTARTAPSQSMSA